MNWNKKEIEQMLRKGMTQAAIAKSYNVTRSRMNQVVTALGLRPLAMRERARQKRKADAERAKEKAAGKITQARVLREAGLFRCSACGLMKELDESASAPTAARLIYRCKDCGREQRKASYRKQRA